MRSYLPADHPDKHREIGSEPTPAEFLQTLLELTAGWRRVLAPHGSICVELGDTYSGGGGEDKRADDTGRVTGSGPNAYGASTVITRGQGTPQHRKGDSWPLDKSMCGIPHLYHLSLAYGRNLLTGEPSPAGQWRVRNVVAWCRPNPPVGALGDKFRPATSYLTIATVARDRYFDLDAVRTASGDEPKLTKVGKASASRGITGGDSGNPDKARMSHNPAGTPPLDYWVIPTAPYSGAHYATYPPDLCTRPILSMCPQRVCTVCGEPSRRIVEDNPELAAAKAKVGGKWQSGGLEQGLKRPKGADRIDAPGGGITVGWTECECPGGDARWRNGLVLDPFGGSGTTGMVATGHGRDAVLIDIDERNADLARERIGMFLTVEHHEPNAA